MAAFNSADKTPDATMKPFPFLRLPKDIRLMVYERFSVVTWYYHVPGAVQPLKKSRSLNSNQTDHVVLIMTGICAQVMATCKQIRGESESIIKRKIQNELCRQIPRIIIEGDDFRQLIHHPYHRGLLLAIFESLLHRTGERECPEDWDREKDFENWCESRQWFTSQIDIRHREGQKAGRLTPVAKFIWQAGVILTQMYQQRRLSIPAHQVSIAITVPVAILRKPRVWNNNASSQEINSSKISSIRREVTANLIYPLQTTFGDRSESPVPQTFHRLPTSVNISKAGHGHLIYFPLPFASFSGQVIPALSVDETGAELWEEGWQNEREEGLVSK